MPFTTSTYEGPQDSNLINIRRLLVMRGILLCIQCAIIAYIASADIRYAFTPTLALVVATIGVTLIISAIRLRYRIDFSDLEIASQLIFDILMLCLFLYFLGGATNPLISYLLVPIIISATTLPSLYTWLLVALCSLIYTALLFFYIPFEALSLGNNHHLHGSPISLHIAGMWINFMFSACLVAFFIFRISKTIRNQDEWINKKKQEQVRNDQIMATATLAAGTAHELGTPLTTVTMLTDEMIAEAAQNSQLEEDLHLVRNELEKCRTILTNLVSLAERTKDGVPEKIDPVAFIEKAIGKWRTIRPQARFSFQATSFTGSVISVDASLEQAFINFMNNAANAHESNPESIIEIRLEKDEESILFSIRDHGPGLPEIMNKELGKEFIKSSDGLGIGMALSHATIERFQGKVGVWSHPDGGTIVEIHLPLEASGQ